MVGKLLVWLATAVGVAAFFLPFVSFDYQGKAIGFSAFRLMTTADLVADVAEHEGEKAERSGVTGAAAMSKAQAEELREQMMVVAGVLWGPTALFFLFGLLGLRRYGRVLGVLTLLVGILTVLGWFFLNGEITSDPNAPGSFGIGFTLLLVGAMLGFAAGLFGIIKPQPKRAAAG